jgi:hypothetical protein
VFAAWQDGDEVTCALSTSETTASWMSAPNAEVQCRAALQESASGSSEVCAEAPRCRAPSAADAVDILRREAQQQQYDFSVRDARADTHHQVLLAGAIANVVVVTFATHAVHTHGIAALASAQPGATLAGFAAPVVGFALSRALQPDLRPSALSATLTGVLLVVSGSFVALIAALLASVVRPPLVALALCAALVSVAAAAGWAMIYVAAPSTSGKLTTAADGARAFDAGAWRAAAAAPPRTPVLHPVAPQDASPLNASSRRKLSPATSGRASPLAANGDDDGCGAAGPDADAPRALLDASSSEWFSSHGDLAGLGGGALRSMMTTDTDVSCSERVAVAPTRGRTRRKGTGAGVSGQEAASWKRPVRPQRALLPAVMEVAASFLSDAGELPAVVTDSASPFLILAVNEEWLRATELSRGEVLGHSHGIIQGPRTERVAVDAILKATHALVPTFRVTLINYTKSGRPFQNVLTVHRRRRKTMGRTPARASRAADAGPSAPPLRDMLLAVSRVRYLVKEEEERI